MGLCLEDDLITWKLAHWAIELQKLLVQDYRDLQLCCPVDRDLSSSWIEFIHLVINWRPGRYDYERDVNLY